MAAQKGGKGKGIGTGFGEERISRKSRENMAERLLSTLCPGRKASEKSDQRVEVGQEGNGAEEDG